MKKIILFLFLLVISMIWTRNKKEWFIPNESLRFRIIANSNSLEDQLEKYDLRTKLLPILNKVGNNADTYETTKANIQSELSTIEKIVNDTTENYNISFGKNFFPAKNYNSIQYNAGEYESLVITLGEGMGENWWCVLFPPLCLLEAEKEQLSDLQYDYYLRKIINQFF